MFAKLEIAMNHAVGMSGMDRPRQSFDQRCSHMDGLWRTLEVLGQAAAGHVFQDKVRPAGSLANIVNLDNVGMLQTSDGRGLGAKAVQILWLGLDPVQNHLQRHDTLETKLLGLVDHAHTATSQFPQDFVSWYHRPFGSGRHGSMESGVGRTAGLICRL